MCELLRRSRDNAPLFFFFFFDISPIVVVSLYGVSFSFFLFWLLGCSERGRGGEGERGENSREQKESRGELRILRVRILFLFTKPPLPPA